MDRLLHGMEIVGWGILYLGAFVAGLFVLFGLHDLCDRLSGKRWQRKLEVLRQLREHGASFGLSLVKRSGGKLRRGSVYELLRDMENDGLVHSVEAEASSHTGYPRRLYAITRQGVDRYLSWKGHS